MHNFIKPLNEFLVNEGVNEDLIQAKADVNAKQAEIAEEIAAQKDATDLVQKAASIKKQASLYGQMPALLNKLAAAMEAKSRSGDTTNIY